MNVKYLRVTFACMILSVSGIANAGIITDTTDDTFIDQSTGLEWMDFGVNNSHTYTEVAALLDTTYNGWELASTSQVFSMMSNAFSGKGSIPDIISSTGSRPAVYRNADSTNNSFTSVFTMMGFEFADNTSRLGWFEDLDGTLSYASINYASAFNQIASVNGRGDDFNSFRDIQHTDRSTMLVKFHHHIDVPEPSTLAIFSLGMIGLVSRRFKKQS